jgi:hypothetical protein
LSSSLTGELFGCFRNRFSTAKRLVQTGVAGGRAFRLRICGGTYRGRGQHSDGPARIDHFKIEIESPVELSEKHIRGVEESVHHCLIHNTLLNAPQINVEVRQPAPVGI